MENTILVDLVVVLVVAFAAGALATLLRQPVILGYLIAGLLIGPFTLGLVQHIDQVQLLADIGVVLLMFALGIEVSLGELRRVRRVAIFGGAIQIIATIGLGFLLGLVFGWPWFQALFFGALISLSSTMVVLKLLMDRGQIDTMQGRIATGILIVQDLSVVPMMVVLPALSGQVTDLPLDLGLAAAKAIALLVATVVLGTTLVPKLLFWVSSTHSRELFMLSIVVISLGTAFGTSLFGLSLAFGAFIAGIVLSESVFRHQILAEVLPLRDIFAIIFFASVGMLINPAFIFANAATVAIAVAMIIVGKFLIVFAVTIAFGYSGKVAIYSGLALVQIGEFSFVLAKLAVDQGIINDYLYSLTLSSALLTIILTPFIIQSSPRIAAMFSRIAWFRGLFERIEHERRQPAEELTQHVVICGHGEVGKNLSRVLDTRKFKYFVIDNDPTVVSHLRDKKVPVVYGDAANRDVLALANLSKARVLAVTVTDPISTDLIIKYALAINPKINIVARSNRPGEIELLRDSGASAVVEPKFEAGLEVIRHTLHRFGLTSQEIMMLTSRMRLEHYRGEEEEAQN